MASSESVLSETLQSITVTKIAELEKQRQAYSSSKDEVVRSVDDESKDVRARLALLIKGLSKLKFQSDYSFENNVARWLQQSKFDPSIPDSILLKYERQLRSKLDVRSRRMDLAHLYSQLLTEWIGTPVPTESEVDSLAKSDSDDSFEMIEDTQKARLQQLRDKFALVVFEPLQSDEVEIDNYLSQMFRGHHGENALKRMRDSVSSFGEQMRGETFRIDDQSLKWCIKALLNNQLLSEEKKASLHDFLKDEAVLNEIKDVLNMRFRDLDDWGWNLGESGMPVSP